MNIKSIVCILLKLSQNHMGRKRPCVIDPLNNIMLNNIGQEHPPKRIMHLSKLSFIDPVFH